MPAPLSNDLRVRILLAYKNGKTVKEITEEFYVGQNTVYCLLRLFKETGSHEARENNGGRKPKLTEDDLKNIENKILETPDITLEELKEQLSLPVSISALCRSINKKLGLIYKKKTLYPSAQNREDVKEKRAEWMEEQKVTEASRLVFLDESGLNTGMTRLYGRAKSTERVVDYVPDVRYERVTILSSVRLDGTTVAATFNGALNGKIFTQYINQFLIPELKEGDIVIMDNLSSHKVSGVIDAIEKVGASVLFLPAYSPDLNPIELMWSKIKSFLRKVKARTKESLYEAIGDALNLVTQSDVQGWFNECGYYL